MSDRSCDDGLPFPAGRVLSRQPCAGPEIDRVGLPAKRLNYLTTTGINGGGSHDPGGRPPGSFTILARVFEAVSWGRSPD